MKNVAILLVLILIGFKGVSQFETILKDCVVGFNDIKASEFSFPDEEYLKGQKELRVIYRMNK